jgi:TPR repeat protein
MNSHEAKSIFPVLRRISSYCFLAVLAFWCLPNRVQAQQRVASTPSACAPSDLASLVVQEGNSVRVSSIPERNGDQMHAQEAAEYAGTVHGLSAERPARAAYKIFEREARGGRPAAMVNLAVASLAGWGTQPNAGAALYWLYAAADRGYAPAFYNLGILYFKGCGVWQDYAEAFRFFEKGAQAGDAASEVNLGYFYAHGLGVAEDHGAAAHWYLQAAETGDSEAQYNLADLYLHGEGVSQDDVAAFVWFQKAATQGHAGARIMLGSMYATGRGTAKDLPAACLWISAAALQGDTRGNALLVSVERQLTPAQLAQAKLNAQSLASASGRSRDVASLH